jgi:hypothetical protein
MRLKKMNATDANKVSAKNIYLNDAKNQFTF